jgi:SPP1 gp7 family putative phage head morphogenesis protein
VSRPGQAAIVARLRPPTGVERSIHAKLRKTYVGWLRREFLAALRRQGVTDAVEDPSPRMRALAALAEVRAKLVRDPPAMPDLDPDGAIIVTRANRAAIAATRWAGGLPSVPVVSSAETALRVAAWQVEASRYIEAIPREAIDRLERMMVQKFTDGSRVETIAKAFEEQLGVTDRHAMLLARDQTAKLNAWTHQADFATAGLNEYVWSTSDDERVREGHRELDGTVHRWDEEPPIVDQRTQERGHPGEVFQCRCVALPVAVARGSARA